MCVHTDYLAAVDEIRPQLEADTTFVALEETRPGWLGYEEAIAKADDDIVAAAVSETDVVTINYTSGTTSRPKGVMITHRNAYMNTVGTLIHHPMSAEDRYLWTLPMFHANGWTFVWTVTAAGATHVCLRKVDPATVFDTIERESITVFCAAPTVLIGLANAAPELRRKARPGVRVLTAGAPPAAATIERIEGELGWVLTHVYGLTETAPFITVCEPRREHTTLSAAGRAAIKARQGVELITSGELRVVDDADVEVPHDGETLGEIVARGNVVMQGYYRDPEATARALRGGWFRTGDAAVVHPDGYVEIRDRLKDVIISGGENISSVEVEGVLLKHPAVQEAAVVGLPDERWGEAPHAFVVLRAGGACRCRRAARVRAHTPRPLQGAKGCHLSDGITQDGHGQDSEIRASTRAGDIAAVIYFKTIRSVTFPESIGLTENAGSRRISGVTKGSPSKTISKIFGARPGADTSKWMCAGTRLFGYEPGLTVSKDQAPRASERRNSLSRGFRLSLAGLTL